MKLYTIGFTQHSAEDFFETLRLSGAKRLVDVRLNNVSQLAGFAKRADLEYFLRVVLGITYVHEPKLAPTQELLATYRVDHDWKKYETQFLQLIAGRRIETLPRAIFEDACLLCSEREPTQCHRRLVADYLREHWGDVGIAHL